LLLIFKRLLRQRVYGYEETLRRLDRVSSILPELKEMGPRPAGSVSGGQGKMVALGRALMLGTKLCYSTSPFRA
jgi:branched-chain amino acid transport system ATP-binding protein